jgi:hypothetical protein
MTNLTNRTIEAFGYSISRTVNDYAGKPLDEMTKRELIYIINWQQLNFDNWKDETKRQFQGILNNYKFTGINLFKRLRIHCKELQFRVLKKGNFFYIQYKYLYFWTYLKNGYISKKLPFYLNTREEAEKYIKTYCEFKGEILYKEVK